MPLTTSSSVFSNIETAHRCSYGFSRAGHAGGVGASCDAAPRGTLAGACRCWPGLPVTRQDHTRRESRVHFLTRAGKLVLYRWAGPGINFRGAQRRRRADGATPRRKISAFFIQNRRFSSVFIKICRHTRSRPAPAQVKSGQVLQIGRLEACPADPSMWVVAWQHCVCVACADRCLQIGQSQRAMIMRDEKPVAFPPQRATSQP